MENPSNFHPFTKRQRELLEELKKAVNQTTAISRLDRNFLKIRKEIDELSVKVARFALRPLPKESRQQGLILEVPTLDGRMVSGECKIKLGFADFHPDLPPWAKDHFIAWIQYHRTGLLRHDSHRVLRETGLVGIETGMPGKPIKGEDIQRQELIKQRVLELRGVKENDIKDELQDTKKIRKPSATWRMVIDQLTKEKLLPRKITPQAFKHFLKAHFPDFSWDKV